MRDYVEVAMILLIYIIVAVSSVNFFATLHEDVHKINCEWHGGDAEVKINLWGINGGSTICRNAGDYEISEMAKLDVLNEIVGYHLYALAFTILGCTGAIIVTMVVLSEK